MPEYLSRKDATAMPHGATGGLLTSVRHGVADTSLHHLRYRRHAASLLQPLAQESGPCKYAPFLYGKAHEAFQSAMPVNLRLRVVACQRLRSLAHRIWRGWLSRQASLNGGDHCSQGAKPLERQIISTHYLPVELTTVSRHPKRTNLLVGCPVELVTSADRSIAW